MLKKTKILCLCFLAIPVAATAQDRTVRGPIEQLEIANSRSTVLGQAFVLNEQTLLLLDGRPVSFNPTLAPLVELGSAKVIAAKAGSDSIATCVSLSSEVYVPGASVVQVAGQIADFSSVASRIRIGSLNVDASSISPERLSKLHPGMRVRISGIQPVRQGSLVSPTSIEVLGQPENDNCEPSPELILSNQYSADSKTEVFESGRLQKSGIGGTGGMKLGIGGTGIAAASVTITDRFVGAQKQGIGGTGKQSLGIGGTGVATSGIGATGWFSLTGARPEKQSLGIGGTGVLTPGVSGTGQRKLGIGGTGIQQQGIGGTGAQRESIGGTGKAS